MGSTMAGWVACPAPTSSTAATRLSRRQHPMPNSTMAPAHSNVSWPNSKPSTMAGLTSTAAAHQPLRSSGKAKNVPAIMPRAPITIHRPTTQSPSSGRNRAAVTHGMKP